MPSRLPSPRMTAEVFAPAKINLALHVTGQREDGYHLLDSLVVFAGIGDRISVAPSDRLSLTVTGPEGGGLEAGTDNLVLRAARSFGTGRGAAITLDKRLPVASGIGGGSADAAATLKALASHWGLTVPGADTVLSLGADVPVCLAGHPARMSGIGEVIGRVPDLPDGIALLLVNPRVAVSTPEVFRALPGKDNPAIVTPSRKIRHGAFPCRLAERATQRPGSPGPCPGTRDRRGSGGDWRNRQPVCPHVRIGRDLFRPLRRYPLCRGRRHVPARIKARLVGSGGPCAALKRNGVRPRCQGSPAAASEDG